MKGKCVSIVPLLALFTLVAMSPRDAQADPVGPEDIAHMKAGPTMVEGVVTHRKSGLYTVRTARGTNYTLAESSSVRYGRDVPKVGDEMMLWINEGNELLDANKRGASLSPRILSGKLVSINYGTSQITLSMADGEESFNLRPESRMFREMTVGTPVTIEVCKEGEVIDIHVDKGSVDLPNGHPHNESALVGFRHLGKPQ